MATTLFQKQRLTVFKFGNDTSLNTHLPQLGLAMSNINGKCDYKRCWINLIQSIISLIMWYD